MRSLIRLVLVIMVIAAVASCAWAQGKVEVKEKVVLEKSTLVEQVKGGEIDWANEMITAWADCPVASKSEQPNQAIARKNAETWAKGEAIANLLGTIEQTAISYETYGKDYIIKDVTLRQKIEGYVRGVQVLKTEKVKDEDGGVSMRVTVGTKMYGKGAPGTLLLQEAMEESREPSTDKPKPLPVVVEVPKEAPKPVTPVVKNEVPVVEAQKGPFTSVIIDTRGYSISRAISPKIRTTDGSEVWGTLPVTPDFAIETGIVSYVNSMEMARKSSRCGDNPLILKAIGRAGGKAMCDPVISDEDAKLAKSENAKTKFMDQCKVIFIVDPSTPKTKK